jgi:uncharacterized membrane protein YpjA
MQGSNMHPITLWRELWVNPWQKKFIIPLLIINFLGSIYGYYWYGGQLAETPLIVWLFVPDSPLATTLFTIMAALWLLGGRSSLPAALACAACIKYGLWAVVLITDFWSSGGNIFPTEVMLWLSHLGMALEGWLFLRRLRVAVWAGAGIAAWMGLNDFIDYYFGLHPYLFLPGQFGLALAAAVIMTLALSFMLLAHNARRF